LRQKIFQKKIDFHAHAILPSYIEGLKKLKIDAQAEEGFPLPKWSVEEHLIFGTDYPYVSAPILLKKNLHWTQKLRKEI